jgi:hypothetical protein
LQAMLPMIPEGAGTLGMIDIEDGIDEDYLVPFDTRVGPGQAVQAMARRPVEWVARHLRRHGAMVAAWPEDIFVPGGSEQRPGCRNAR